MSAVYINLLLFTFCVYAILTISASLTTGLGEMLTMCQAAFFGIGAYVGVFFLRHLNYSIVEVAFLVMLVTSISSLFISYASTRLKGDPFIIVTLSFQMIVYCIIYNWRTVTGGDSGIDSPSLKVLFTWELPQQYHWILALVTLILVVLLYQYLKRMPYGRLLRAIRNNDQIIASYGKNVNLLKAQTFFISAALSGLAGLLYASESHFLQPGMLSLDCSILVITALFIGGKDNWKGALLGVFIVFLLRDFFDVSKWPEQWIPSQNIVKNVTLIGNIERALYGLLLILLMYFRPQGLIKDNAPSVTRRKETV